MRMAHPGFGVNMGAPIAVILAALPQVKFPVRILSVPLLLAMLAAISLPAAAQGGPPFIGDDPGTPGDGNWEINLMTCTERHPTERIFNARFLDFSYGLGPRIQLENTATRSHSRVQRPHFTAARRASATSFFVCSSISDGPAFRLTWLARRWFLIPI